MRSFSALACFFTAAAAAAAAGTGRAHLFLPLPGFFLFLLGCQVFLFVPSPVKRLYTCGFFHGVRACACVCAFKTFHCIHA